MRLAIKCAFLAIPVELFMSGFYAYPVDGGFGPDDSRFSRLMSHVWLILHWPGLVALRWLEHRSASALSELLAVYLSGYLALVLLMVCAALGLRWLLRWSRNLAAAHAH
jgi:hypothetical protein